MLSILENGKGMHSIKRLKIRLKITFKKNIFLKFMVGKIHNLLHPVKQLLEWKEL